MAERYLIVGLGNPGRKYESTRHNAGFWVIDELARRYNITVSNSERKAYTGDGMIRGKRVLLAKPQTFMNLSGESVRALMDFYKIERDYLFVVSDDLDLPLGTIRLRMQGSHGGQKGLRNIIQHLGDNTFNRLRFGIDRPPGRMPVESYVLQPFIGDDQITAKIVVDRAADAVETFLADGMEITMSRHNGKVDEPNPT